MRYAATIALCAMLVACGGGSAPAAGGDAKACAAAPVVAHDASGVTIDSATPQACALRTGFPSAETHIRLARNDLVVQWPALQLDGVFGTGFFAGAPGPHPETQLSVARFATSRDGGESWSLLGPGGVSWVAQDASLHVDRDDGRIYFYALAVNPVPQDGVPLPDQVPSVSAHLVASGDDGQSWQVNNLFGYLDSENPRFATAPPVAGQAAPSVGSNVAYWCGNNMLFTYVVRICHRSLDGGGSWQQASVLLSKGLPQHPECGGSAEEFSSYDGYYPQAAPDGSLWLLVACGGSTFLARSVDEAASFPILKAADGAPLAIPPAEELRVDRLGNLYAVHLGGEGLELRLSRDQGRSWSEPRNLTAPAARGAVIEQWALAVREPGQLAVAYLAARGDGGYDGYLGATREALEASPRLFSARFGGEQPLVTRIQQAKDDYIDVDLGADGSAWAAFFADCTGADDPACAPAAGAPNPLGKATVIGRLQWR